MAAACGRSGRRCCAHLQGLDEGRQPPWRLDRPPAHFDAAADHRARRARVAAQPSLELRGAHVGDASDKLLLHVIERDRHHVVHGRRLGVDGRVGRGARRRRLGADRSGGLGELVISYGVEVI